MLKASQTPYLTKQIRRLSINLDKVHKGKEATELFTICIALIDKDLDFTASQELFALILNCFSLFPNQQKEIFDNFLLNARNNENRIILTSKLIIQLKQKNSDLPVYKFQIFIDESFSQISKQLQKRENENFLIFDKKISKKYEYNFVIDILLLIDLKQKQITDFYPYLLINFDKIEKNKIFELIQKVINQNLVSTIPESILTDDRIIGNFSVDNWSAIIPQLTKESFIKILSKIDIDFNHTIAVCILDKIVEYQMQYEFIKDLLTEITPSDMKIEVWKYLSSFNVILPSSLARNIDDFPDAISAIKIMPKINRIPSDIVDSVMLINTDFKVYNIIFDSNYRFYNREIYSSKQFWSHVISFMSTTTGFADEQNVKNLFESFIDLFIEFISEDILSGIIDSMIFDNFPTSNLANDFLYKLFDIIQKADLNLLFHKVLEKKVIPYPSFWTLFQLEDIEGIDFLNPLAIYALYFSNTDKNIYKYTEVKILPQTHPENDDIILNFIDQKFYDNIAKVNFEVLSLITSAIAFLCTDPKPKIQGLTDELILPFFAISFIYSIIDGSSFLSISTELKDSFNKACQNLSKNKSLLQNKSIDSILQNHKYLFDKNIFPIDESMQIMDILISLLLNDSYFADKLILLNSIFILSSIKDIEDESKKLFKKHGIKVIQYIISVMDDLKDFEFKLNLEIFNADEVKSFFTDKIENSSLIDVINIITFIQKICINDPELAITFPKNLTQVFKELIYTKNWDSVLLIGQYMNDHNLKNVLSQFIDEPIPFNIKRKLFDSLQIEGNDLISFLLTDENPEENYDFIFEKLMQNKSIAINYFLYLFEIIGHKYVVDQSDFLEIFHNEYNLYEEYFLEALSIAFTYKEDEGIFIRNPIIHKPTQLKQGYSLVSNLLNKASDIDAEFPVFDCLYNIASAFPFLFNKNPRLVFQIVYQRFSKSLVEYLFLNEGTIESVKTEIYSFLFLIKCLFSIEILNVFFPWFIENIKKINEYQLSLSLYIIEFLFEIKKVRQAMYSLSIKYNFLEILKNLLDKSINAKIQNKYKLTIYNIVYNFFDTLNKIIIIQNVYIYELCQTENQFLTLFENFSSIYYHFNVSCFSCIDGNSYAIKDISRFITGKSEIKIHYYYLSSKNTERDEDIEQLDIDNFLIKFIDYQDPDALKCSIKVPHCTFYIKRCHIRHLINKPYWSFRYLFKGKTFPLLPKHKEIMSEVINCLEKLDTKSKNETNYFLFKFIESFTNLFCNKKLFRKLIEESIFGDINRFPVINLIYDLFPFYKNIFLCFLQQLNDILDTNKNNRINYQRLFIILDKFTSNSHFSNNFIQICGNNFIEFALLPENRNDQNFLKLLVHLLKDFIATNLPPNTAYLIAFMLIQKNVDTMNLALEICEKVDEKYFDEIRSTIEVSFDYVLKDKKLSYFIPIFISKIPSLSNYRRKEMINLLNSATKSYIRGRNSDDIIEIIAVFFNSLAPKRNSDQIVIDENNPDTLQLKMEDEYSSQIDDFIVGQVSQNIFKKNPEFWKLFQLHRITINSILVSDETMLQKMKFLFYFPGLLDFKTRLDYFEEKMTNKIVVDEDEDDIVLYVQRDNVLLSSVEYLNELEPYEFLKQMQINFYGEEGIDAGGLTKEWYSLMIKEILSEEKKLFILTDRKSYRPNPYSYQVKNHLGLFKFAGKIIARAIIQKQCINAHFTRSFYKQILNLPVKFRDLEDYDSEMFTSLDNVLKNDVEPLCLNFTIDVKNDESVETILLKKKGDEINVTNENKKEYVDLYSNYHLIDSISDQVDAFREGFYSIISPDEICYFSPVELDLIICGIPEIDLNDLRLNTEYEYPYNDNHPVVGMFFDVISKWDKNNLAKLLEFITGSSQVPLNGFVEYKNEGKPIRIIPGGEKDRLCVAHTCFNILALPSYEDEDELNDKLLLSIQQCEFELI